jgi:predicted nucleotidyltransferase
MAEDPGGPLGDRLSSQREQVLEITARHRLSNVQVFGSVARGDERADSDIDLLVDVTPGVGIFELGRCRGELESLLGARVDLIPAADLKEGVAVEVAADARPL